MRILAQGSLVAWLLLDASPALAKDVYVWGSSTGGQTGTSFASGYPKVSTALAQAATGDVIHVKSPLCENATIVVDKRVTLVGEVGASYVCANEGVTPVMRVTADDVKLQRLGFILGGRYGSGSGIDASAARVTVEETSFRFTSTIGGDARGVILSTGTVHKSSFTDSFAVAIDARGTANITENTFTKTRTAILVTNASPKIERNTFSDLPLAIDVVGGIPKIEKNSIAPFYGGIGVQLTNSSAWVFENEIKAYSSNATGIVVRADQETPYIAYNTIKTTRGVDIAGGGARVFDNFFESFEGVRLARSQSVVAHNTFQSAGADVKDVACVQSGPKHDTTLVVNNLFFKGRNAYSGIGGCGVKVQTNVVCSDAAAPFSGSYLDGGGNRTRQTCSFRGFARTDPMVDMGTVLGFAWLRDDITHAVRDSKPDAGAYEYLPAFEVRRLER